MTGTIAQIPIADLTPKVTLEINIVGYRGWLIRLGLAKLLIRLACRIIKVNYGINEVEE